jgi:hypothetical protein
MEFYLWGKSELEDMLFLPKNDSILFAFFGLSLITRKRLRATEIKFSINNKNKLLRILGDGDAAQTLSKTFLARDFKDVHYPWKNDYKDFDKAPRWKEYTAVGFHPLGLIADVAQYFAFVDRRKKTWDYVSSENLIRRQTEDDEDPARSKEDFENREKIRNFWRYLPRDNQAQLVLQGVISFEDMLVIDEKGDAEHLFPHIFIDFRTQSGPFRFFFRSLRIGNQETPLNDEYKQVPVFPATFPPPRKRKVYRDRAVQLDEDSRRRFGSSYSLKSLFDVDGKYGFLDQGDVIRVEGVKPPADDKEAFIEITCKYETGAKEYVTERPELREQIEKQTGKKLNDNDALTVLEFEHAWSWQLKDE